MPGAADAILLLACGVATYTDMKDGKIPNGITAPLMMAGLLLNLIDGALVFALLGLAFAFVIHFSLWAAGVVKGGDAKLMMGVGAVIGWREVLETTLWQFVLFAPVGLVFLAMVGRLGNFFETLKWFSFKVRGVEYPKPDQQTWMIKAPIILAAVYVSRLTNLLGTEAL